MAKRSRANPSPLDDPSSDGYPLPLACVRVVCQNGPGILHLPHIVAKLKKYLDSSCKWALTKACATDSPYLVERLLLRQAAEAITSVWHSSKYRQWQFDKSLDGAAKVGNLKVVQLLEMHFRDCCISKEFLQSATRRGLSDIVKWLVECSCDVEWDAEVVREAIRSGHFELAKWLKERIKTTIVDEMTEWAAAAAVKGDLAMVKDLFNERDATGSFRFVSEKVDLWRVVQSATDFGQLDVLKWIMEERDRNVLLYEISHREREGKPPVKIDFSRAAARGYLAILTWLIHHYPRMCDVGYAYFTAADNGHLDIIRLLLSSRIRNNALWNTVDVAAGKGHLDVVKRLVSAGFPVNHVMNIAAARGFLDMVTFLHENASHSCGTGAMNNAASYGHLDAVKWLHFNREEGCSTNAMDNAAGCGHLLVVQWLHENRREGCTKRAMDMAARNGHLEVVKWLHFHRREGCTTAAMDYAAGNGHLDVVKWLHVNRSEGCTSSAMDLAARKN